MTEDQIFMPIATPEQVQECLDKCRAQIAANNEAFCEAFGDFADAHVTGFQMGPGPDGRYFGFVFDIEGKGNVNVALSAEMWGIFLNELVLMLNVAGERFTTAFGITGGNA
jgi:hypothetical protein